MKKRTKRLIILGVAVVLVGVGVYFYAHSESDYITVSQLVSGGDALRGKYLKVAGEVYPGSISWDNKTGVISFVLSDGGKKMDVVHQGAVPRDFKPGAEVMVVGRYRDSSVFEASGFSERRSLCNVCH